MICAGTLNMNEDMKDKPSLALNIACFVGTFIISLCLSFAMFLFWLMIMVAAFAVNKSQTASRRTKSAYSSALLCVMCFVVALALWPVFRVVAPRYFDEGWDKKTGTVIRH
jgi:hypothetical protein